MARTVLLLIVGTAVVTASGAAGQQREISGRLAVRTGTPFAGAAIEVVGQPGHVCADSDGGFRITAPDREVRLRITPLGLDPQELVVARGDGTVAFGLPEHVVTLDSMQVVGYAGSLLTGGTDLNTLDGRELNQGRAATVDAAMQGKVSGVAVQSNSGAPGGGFSIDLRGVRTILGNSQPLVIIDGTAVSNATIDSGVGVLTGTRSSETNAINRIADINPDDIAHIEFLKGASAAAMYGSKAGAGVVVITTRRGTPGPAEPQAQPLECFRFHKN